MINQKLVSEAKYRLAHSLLSVKEISAEIGFDDPNYFSYFFKRETGWTPLTYRESFASGSFSDPQ